MRLARNGWWLYLALIAPVTVLYLAGPLSYGPVFNAIGFSASAAIVVGVRKHRPAARWAWYLIALGQALFVAGDVLAYNYEALFGTQLPNPSIADPLYLAVYPVTVVGLLLLIRRRNPGRDWASLVDSLIVTIGLALVSWIFLIAPYAHDRTLHLDVKLVSMAYPLMDILVLGVVLRMAAGAGRRSAAYYMMICAVGALLITDSVYGWINLHGIYHPGDVLDGGWIVYYALLGAAALHPSMTTVSHAAAPTSKLTRARIAGIGFAVLLTPVIEIVRGAADSRSDAYVIEGAAVILFGLVVARMFGLVRAQEQTAERERALREAQEALVTATNPAEIVRAAENAATRLAGAVARPCVLRVEEVDGTKYLTTQREGVGPDGLAVPIASLPEDFVAQLIRRITIEIPNARAQLGHQAPPAPGVMVPFLVQGELAGAVALLNASGTSASLRHSLEALAGQVGLALESAALTEHVLRSESELRFRALVQHSSDVMFVVAPDTTVQYASPSVQRMLKRHSGEFVGKRLTDYVPQEDRALVRAALASLPSRSADTTEALDFRIRHSDGRWLHTEGLVTNLLANRAVGGLVVNLRDITERKQFEEQLAYQAFHDPVTDLANRALFSDRVKHALLKRHERERPLAVLCLDLDDFKSINDTFGRVAGDGLLRTISSRLEATLRVGDTIARIGGDEFAMLLEGIDHETGLSELADRLLEVVRAPLSVQQREVYIECSIGIAVARPTAVGATTVNELLRDADVAIYQAKNAGGDTHRFFKPEMQASVVEQLELRADLKAAVEQDQLTLAYQPIFDLQTGAVSGYEALLRWTHPSRGAVAPNVFIPVAEESGLIVPIGRWVLERACLEAVELERACPGPRARKLSVNLSARQLQRPEIVDEVRAALRSSGLEPRNLVLEITESMLVDELELAIERLGALRELGVQVAVDDFGTGYSSLNYLRRLPANILKVDKCFIDGICDDEEQRKLTAVIVDMARVLKLQCVAEGVEQPEQLEFLKRLGCEYAQGFLLARPMDAGALLQFLRTSVVHEIPRAGVSSPIAAQTLR